MKYNMNTREMGSFISNIRRGRTPFKVIGLNNGDETFDVAIVLLSSDLMCDINDRVCEKYGESEEESEQLTKSKNIYYNTLLAYYCTRVPKVPYTEYVADSYKEFCSYMDLEDIDRIVKAYNELLISKCDKIELLTDDRLEELVNFLEKQRGGDWKDLDTIAYIHLTNLYNNLKPIMKKMDGQESLQTDNYSGFLLIEE